MQLVPLHRGGASSVPLRKKAHADSGTLTILARGAATEGAAGGLQLLDGRADTWVDVPVLPGGVYDGDASALLVNLGGATVRVAVDSHSLRAPGFINP
jgi:isopenicillin N synthase-like dioxygenase